MGCLADRFGAIGDSEFGIDGRAVKFDGVLADA
jgi:hypothetical protein